MTDDSSSSTTPGQPAEGGTPPPPPFEPDRTVMRPRDPEPPAGAIDDGDAAPPTPAPAPPLAGGFPGGFGGEPPARSAPGPVMPTRVSKAGTTGAVAALGAGLLGAAVAISVERSRADGELDWSNFGVGLGATAVLLLIALVGAFSARKVGGRAREEVVTWPGVVGILSAAAMLAVAIDRDDDWVAYLVGGVMVALAAIGYVAARRAAFVVVAIAGLAIIYLVAFGELVADNLGEGHPQVVAAVMLALFVVVVTLLGWALPSRAVTGVVVGVAGVVGFHVIVASFIVMRYIGDFLFPFASVMEGMDGRELSGDFLGFDEADVWWVLGLAAILTVLWALAAAVSNHSGFSVLAVVMPAGLVPLAATALAVEHPTWWAAALAAGGGVLLLGGVALARLRGRAVAREV